MSTPELRPLTPRPQRRVLLAVLAVLATTAVIAGLILGTVGLVRTTQLTKSNHAIALVNRKNLLVQCDAQQIVIQNQARGIRDGAALFSTVLPPNKLRKAIRASRRDLRKLKHVRARLSCPRAHGPTRHLVIPDTVLDARHRPRNGERARAALGGGTSNGPAPQSPIGPPAGGPPAAGPEVPPAPIDTVCDTAAVPLICP